MISPGGVWGLRPQRIPYQKKNAVSEQDAKHPTIETVLICKASIIKANQRSLGTCRSSFDVLCCSQFVPALSFKNGIAIVAFGSAAILAWALREWGRWAAAQTCLGISSPNPFLASRLQLASSALNRPAGQTRPASSWVPVPSARSACSSESTASRRRCDPRRSCRCPRAFSCRRPARESCG